ncbi:growth-regulated alpha protein [Lates calcarifer]|uniref:C-X-C motif chemokine n=1 Tax=Lates calcarifer TaxID=8187 RepID=A0AAJ7VLY6_LATCA|nr:growth-regulated alpha protein [Lates calcarifer]
MNTAIRCIVLLGCMVVCTSQPVIRCRCLKTSSRVNLSLITGVTVINPSPYCDKTEVIVQLKGKRERCLDPKGKLTQALLQYIHRAKARVNKMNTTVPTPTTVPTTIVPTS